MNFKVGDLIHIKQWFNHKTDHVAEITRAIPGYGIEFEPEIEPPSQLNTGSLSEEFFNSCVIERG